MLSCSVMSDSLQPYGLQPTRLFCPWNFPGKNTGVFCHFLPLGIFTTQRSELHLLHLLSCIVQFSCLVVSDPCNPMDCMQHGRLPCPSWSLLKLMSIESVMPSNHLSLCHPLLLLPSIFPSIRVFSNESVLCIKWP